MDVETTAAIDRLTDRIDTLEATMQAGFASVREESAGEFASVRAEFRGEFVSVRCEMAQMRDELRAEIRDGLAENRRHTQMLFESLRDDIRMLADAVATISMRLDTRH